MMKPGTWTSFETPQQVEEETDTESPSPFGMFLDKIPRSIMGPLGDQQNIIGIILIAVAFGVAMRNVKDKTSAERDGHYRDRLRNAFDRLTLDHSFGTARRVLHRRQSSRYRRVRSVQGHGRFYFGCSRSAHSSDNLVSRSHPVLFLGKPLDRTKRRTRCPGDGVFDRQFHSDDARSRTPA